MFAAIHFRQYEHVTIYARTKMGENPIPETLNSTVRPTRDYALDLLRILSCLGIVILHESGYMPLTSIGWSTYQALVRPCLWVFALISGYFILGRPIKDMKSFYLKKVSTIVIPLIVYSLIYQLWNGRHSFDSIISFSASSPLRQYSLIRLLDISGLSTL